MSKIKNRVFIVGAPRSGTTLLQSLLAAHPEIASFPESHVFRDFVVHYKPWAWIWGNILGLAKPRAIARFNSFLQAIDQEQLRSCLPKNALFVRQYALAFIKILDTVTEQQGKSIWIEKTPQHLHCVDYIEKLIPEVQFIHIIRNGTDVVASQYDAAKNNPKVWKDRQSIDRCIDLWIKDVQTNLQHLHKFNHMLVRYEKLVEDAQSVLEEICKFLAISFTDIMLQQYSTVAEQLILKRELPWKNTVSKPICNTNGNKFSKLFDEPQKHYIIERLSQFNIEERLNASAIQIKSN